MPYGLLPRVFGGAAVLIASIIIFGISAAVAVLPAQATDYTSTNFILRDPVITSGGGRATSSGFQLVNALSQTIVGENTSSAFMYRAGFLYFPAPAPAAVTPAPTPAAPGGGGGIPQTIGPVSAPTELRPGVPAPLPGVVPEGVEALPSYLLRPIPRVDRNRVLRLCDFNSDEKCDIIDLSIMLYYSPRGGPEIARYDLNKNGRIGVSDISILVFYWDYWI